MPVSRQYQGLFVGLCLLFGVLCAWMALVPRDNSVIDGAIVPMSNDAFYQARRIIDVANGDGVTQFDAKTHAPEGSWVNWPWGYAAAAGGALHIAQKLDGELEPMAFLAWIPVLFALLNATLVLAIGRQLGLPLAILACVGLTLALSATMQSLHQFANVDHHFIELSFILASILALLHWLRHPERPTAGLATGLALGAAPAMHIGAFILQLPVLVVLFLLWTRDELPAARAIYAMAAALLCTTLAILLPSAAVYDGQFALYTLSWFHGYVALCSALVASFMARRRCSVKNLTQLAVLSLLLAIPLLGSVVLGSQFLSGELALFNIISEVRSPLAQLFDASARSDVFRLHSWLILATPLVALSFVLQIAGFWRKASPTPPVMLAFAVSGLFGLMLMCLQQRLLYFGIAALYLGVAQLFTLAPLNRLRAPLPALILLVLIAVSAQPQLRYQLFGERTPGADINYALNYEQFAHIEAVCAEAPGLMIALNNDGHPIRYHSDCAVLVNNMIITRQHAEKIREMFRLVMLSPDAFLTEMPAPTRYLYVRLDGVLVFRGNQVGVRGRDAIRQINPPLFMALAEADRPPPGYTLISEVRSPFAPDLPLSQLYRVTRGSEPATNNELSPAR